MVENLKMEMLKVIISDYCNFEHSLRMNISMDIRGNPTGNIIDVYTCAGCVLRNQNDGPYRWEHEFTHNPGVPHLQREAKRKIARWSRTFTPFSGCQQCLEALFNITGVMLMN